MSSGAAFLPGASLHFNKNTEGKAVYQCFMDLLSLTFFNTPSHKETRSHTRTLLIMFHPLTLFLTLLNPHIHLSFLSLSPPKLSELSPFPSPRFFSLSFSSPSLVSVPCLVILSLITFVRSLSRRGSFLIKGHVYLLNTRGYSKNCLVKGRTHTYNHKALLHPPLVWLLYLYECVLPTHWCKLSWVYITFCKLRKCSVNAIYKNNSYKKLSKLLLNANMDFSKNSTASYLCGRFAQTYVANNTAEFCRFNPQTFTLWGT